MELTQLIKATEGCVYSEEKLKVLEELDQHQGK